MTITPLRAVRLAGLLLVAVCVLASPAAAKGPEQAYRAALPPAAGATSGASVSDGQCPCNAGLPQASVASASSPAVCPCNAGLPDGPSAALSARLMPSPSHPPAPLESSRCLTRSAPATQAYPWGRPPTSRRSSVPATWRAEPARRAPHAAACQQPRRALRQRDPRDPRLHGRRDSPLGEPIEPNLRLGRRERGSRRHGWDRTAHPRRGIAVRPTPRERATPGVVVSFARARARANEAGRGHAVRVPSAR